MRIHRTLQLYVVEQCVLSEERSLKISSQLRGVISTREGENDKENLPEVAVNFQEVTRKELDSKGQQR